MTLLSGWYFKAKDYPPFATPMETRASHLENLNISLTRLSTEIRKTAFNNPHHCLSGDTGWFSLKSVVIKIIIILLYILLVSIIIIIITIDHTCRAFCVFTVQ